jgi:hypothetical protein
MISARRAASAGSTPVMYRRFQSRSGIVPRRPSNSSARSRHSRKDVGVVGLLAVL